MTAALAKPRTFATRTNADGTVTVLDVPVFAESVDARGGGKALVHDVQRMQSWLRAAERRYQESGYEAPLHVGHHYDPSGREVKAAGHWRPTRLVRKTIDGAKRWALLADLTVQPEVYEQIRRGRLLYRSVEIKPDMSELLSLALLDHEAPFHKLELLRVSDVTGRALTYAEGGMVMDPEKDESEKPVASMEAPDDKSVNMQEAEAAPPAWAGAMLKVLGAIAAKLGVMDNGDGEVEGDAETPPAETRPAELSMSDTTPAVAKLEGKLIAMQRRLDAQDRAVRLEATERRLRDAGFGEGEAKIYRETVRKSGESAGLAFVEGLVHVGGTAAKEPTSWAASGEGAPSRVTPGDVPEVLAYAERGADVLARARRFAQNHALTRSKVALADYLRFNMSEV